MHQIGEIVPVVGIEIVVRDLRICRILVCFQPAIMNGSKNITASKAMIDFLRTSEATGEGKRHGVRLIRPPWTLSLEVSC